MSEMGMAMMGTGKARGDDRATVATEAAINSPLLEDVDLKGARGILVNITAGLDMSLGEFSEVGSIVEEYASENATIVVGTVIDPEMTDELKVTVVATGLGQVQAEELKVVNGGTTTRAVASSKTDFNQLELPTVLRNRDRGEERTRKPIREHENEMMQIPMKKTGTDDMDFLDIPAFLRRQAD
jgi:cell division protein FtsZ